MQYSMRYPHNESVLYHNRLNFQANFQNRGRQLSRRPFIRQEFRLLQYIFRCKQLFIRGITVLPEKSFYNNFKFCSNAFFYCPVNRSIVFNPLDQNPCQISQFFIAQNFPGAFIICQGIIESQFLISEIKLFTSFVGVPNILFLHFQVYLPNRF